MADTIERSVSIVSDVHCWATCNEVIRKLSQIVVKHPPSVMISIYIFDPRREAIVCVK